MYYRWIKSKLRMDNKPSSSVEILISKAFSLLSQFQFNVPGWEDMKSCRSSVLNYKSGLLSFCDDSAKTCEWIGVGIWIIILLRYGVLIVSSICFFLVENMNDNGIGCLNAVFKSLWVIMWLIYIILSNINLLLYLFLSKKSKFKWTSNFRNFQDFRSYRNQ